MIEVDFKINDEYLTKDYLHLIEEESEVVLRTTCFLMPTMFLINGVDIFHNKKYPQLGPWHDMPIIGWTTEILALIKNLPKKKNDKYVFSHEGYHDILFEMKKNGKVKLIYKETKSEFIVDYEELLNAFLKFEKKVKRFLNKYVPKLKEHPYQGNWLKNKAEYDVDKGLISIKE